MNTKRLILGIAAIALLAGGWYAFRPERLFVNQTVNEGLATASPTPAGSMSASTEGSMSADTEGSMSAVSERMMSGAPKAIAAGMFHNGSHETSGKAEIFEIDGKRVLRLSDFHTSNGPDVQVYLVAASDAKDNETVTQAGFLRVAALKGNIGDQNYELPADVDLNKYRAVTIWCRRFGVNFGTAPLTLHS